MLQVDEAQAEHGDPAAPPIISKLFSIPMDVLLAAVPKVEEFLASSTLASLLDTRVQREVITNCTGQQLDINCRDEDNVSCVTTRQTRLTGGAGWGPPDRCGRTVSAC